MSHQNNNFRLRVFTACYQKFQQSIKTELSILLSKFKYKSYLLTNTTITNCYNRLFSGYELLINSYPFYELQNKQHQLTINEVKYEY